MYVMTPTDHMSTSGPYAQPRSISGAGQEKWREREREMRFREREEAEVEKDRKGPYQTGKGYSHSVSCRNNY